MKAQLPRSLSLSLAWLPLLFIGFRRCRPAGEQGGEREGCLRACMVGLSPSIVGSSNLISAGFLPSSSLSPNAEAAAINHSLLSPPSFLTYSSAVPCFQLGTVLPTRMKERPASPLALGPALQAYPSCCHLGCVYFFLLTVMTHHEQNKTNTTYR